MMKLLKRILKDRPNLKVIVSKILPMKDSNLQAKREIFNALVFLFFIFLFFSELVEDPNISFVAHENLHFTEGHHPSQYEGVVCHREESWQTYS